MSALDPEFSVSPGDAPVFEFMVRNWPDRDTALIHATRAGRSDVLVILRDEPVSRPMPKFTPTGDVRATGSLPVVQ